MTGLPGKCTFNEVAARVDMSANLLRQYLYDPTCPRLESIGRFAGAHVFDDLDVDRWAAHFKKWRDGAPARAAAKRAEAAARQQAVLEMMERQYSERKRIEDVMRAADEALQAAGAKGQQDAHDEMIRTSKSITHMAKRGS